MWFVSCHVQINTHITQDVSARMRSFFFLNSIPQSVCSDVRFEFLLVIVVIVVSRKNSGVVC